MLVTATKCHESTVYVLIITEITLLHQYWSIQDCIISFLKAEYMWPWKRQYYQDKCLPGSSQAQQEVLWVPPFLLDNTIELSQKYVQKRKLMANLLKTEITVPSQREFWCSLKNHLKQAVTMLPKATRSSPLVVFSLSWSSPLSRSFNKNPTVIVRTLPCLT
jgi:hypothetical protein